jgi:hypothetical protein
MEAMILGDAGRGDDVRADRDHDGAEPQVERVFNPDRKDTHRGKRKLKWDEKRSPEGEITKRESKPSRFRKAGLSALDRLGQFRRLRRLIGHRAHKLRKSSIR